jgi:hypothetical protein
MLNSNYGEANVAGRKILLRQGLSRRDFDQAVEAARQSIKFAE